MPASDVVKVYTDACGREKVAYAQVFVDALANNTKIAQLSRHEPALKDADLRCIAEVVRAMPEACNVRVLNLEENAFGLDGVQALMDAIEANPGHIREVRLGKNSLKDQAGAIIGHTLSRGGFGLKVLDLSENGITKLGVIPIAAAIQNPSCDIVELSFHNNAIDSEAAMFLAQAIRSAPKLKHLHLGYNALRDSGAAQLAKSLPEARCLSTLDLTANRIGREGGAEIATALVSPGCTVQRLNLRHNQLDSDTIARFGAVLTVNTSLIQLFLGYMNPNTDAIEAVLGALPENQTLLLLDIYGWKMSPKLAAELTRNVLRSDASVAALVTDACQPIAKQIDSENVDREERALAPIYVGPDDRDAYLATKSQRRYSRAQSRRQSRASSRIRAESQDASAAGGRAESGPRRASTRGSRASSRAASERDGAVPSSHKRSTSASSRPRGTGSRSGSTRHREPKEEAVVAAPAAAPAAPSTEGRRSGRTPRSGKTPRSARSARSPRPGSARARDADDEGPSSRRSAHRHHHASAPPATTQSADVLQICDNPVVAPEDRDINRLLDELHHTPCDPETALIVEQTVRQLQTTIQRNRASQERLMRDILRRLEAVEARGECRCDGSGHAAAAAATTAGQAPSRATSAAPAGTGYRAGSISAIASYPSTGAPQRAAPSQAMHAAGAGTSATPYGSYVNRQTSPSAVPFARTNSNYSATGGGMAGSHEDYPQRSGTPLVRPTLEASTAPPDNAHSNYESGERKPDEASLQRSASVQNFPPRIEPSPAQDSNPPRPKSVSHRF